MNLQPSSDINGFLAHIQFMNTYNLDEFIPFYIENQPVGYIHLDYIPWFKEHQNVFKYNPQAISLHSSLNSPHARTLAVDYIISQWLEEGRIDAVDEDYDLVTAWGEVPLMKIRRGPHRLFGILSYGVHINGFQLKENKLHMWIARRTRNKMTYPGKLDTFVAGGRPSEMNPWEVVLKECYEEASIPPPIAQNTIATGAISYQRQLGKTLERDTMFVYDLEIPSDIFPKPNDHEVESFYCWPIEKIANIVKSGWEFKDNCNLVIIDFLIRHGYLTSNDNNYLHLLHGLHAVIH